MITTLTELLSELGTKRPIHVGEIVLREKLGVSHEEFERLIEENKDKIEIKRGLNFRYITLLTEVGSFGSNK